MVSLPNMLYLASIWAIPVVIAVTFHEAAHGFVAPSQLIASSTDSVIRTILRLTGNT